jgi:Fe2+ transport system protein B
MDEKRQMPDRRNQPTRPFSRYSLKGLRSKSRRNGEDKDYYVDRYEPLYFVLITLILLLCVLDAYFTLKILQEGGKELNPFMLRIMEKNPVLALVVKYLITAAGIGILVVFKNFVVFGRIRVSWLIPLVFLIYLFLVVFEISFYYGRLHAPELFP